MTEEIKTYRTEDLMKTDKRIMNGRGFYSKHTDFINNDRNQGFRVTYVDTIIPTPVSFFRRKILRQKLNDDTITFTELKEYLRITS